MPDDEKKLFVGRLPANIRDDEIRLIFNTYGRVADVHIMGTTRPGHSGEEQRGAFVTYETLQGARAAVQVLDNVYKFREDSSEPIHVSVARPKRDGKDGGKGGKGSDSYYDQRNNGRHDDYNKSGQNRGYDRGDRAAPASYDRGYDRDRGYGNGGNSYDRGSSDRGSYDRGGYDRGGHDRGGHDRGGRDRGSGYDRSGGYDRGGGGYDRARSNSHPAPAYGRDAGRSQYHDSGSRGYDRARDHRDGGKGADTPRGGGGTKLFVGNLPADITKEAMNLVFSTYGRLGDIHLMLGRAKNGQSGAFVVYDNAEDAQTAVAAMATGYEIRPGEGNIFVKYADDGKGKGNDKGGSGRSKPY